MAYTPSKHEEVLDALAALIKAAIPDADFYRNLDKPVSPAPGGVVVLRDGDAGEPEWDYSPPVANYSRNVGLEVLGPKATSLTPEQAVDSLLQLIGAAVEANPTLGGLVEGMTLIAADDSWTTTEGAASLRNATAGVLVDYRTPHPL